MILLSKYLVVILLLLMVSTGLCRVASGTDVCTEQIYAAPGTEQFFNSKAVKSFNNKAEIIRPVCKMQLDMPTDNYKHCNVQVRHISSEAVNLCPDLRNGETGTYVNDFLAVRHMHGYYIYSLCELLV